MKGYNAQVCSSRICDDDGNLSDAYGEYPALPNEESNFSRPVSDELLHIRIYPSYHGENAHYSGDPRVFVDAFGRAWRLVDVYQVVPHPSFPNSSWDGRNVMDPFMSFWVGVVPWGGPEGGWTAHEDREAKELIQSEPQNPVLWSYGEARKRGLVLLKQRAMAGRSDRYYTRDQVYARLATIDEDGNPLPKSGKSGGVSSGYLLGMSIVLWAAWRVKKRLIG